MNPGGALYLLPILICGYLLGITFWPTRFFLIRLDGQRLFLACAGIGVFWVSFLFILAHFLKIQEFLWLSSVASFIHGAMDFPHAAKLVLCVFLSVALPLFLNFLAWLLVGLSGAFWGKRDNASEWINRIAVSLYGGPLAKMLTRAADEQLPVMVVLDSRKVYCGYVIEIGPNVEREGYIGVLPIKSFTRDKDSLRFSEEIVYHAVEVELVESAIKVEQKRLRRLICAYRKYISISQRASWIINIFRYCGAEVVSQEEIKAKLRVMAASLRSRKEKLSKLGLGKKLVRKDWTKLIPVDSIESVSFYEEAATRKWFAPQTVGVVSQAASPESIQSCDVSGAEAGSLPT